MKRVGQLIYPAIPYSLTTLCKENENACVRKSIYISFALVCINSKLLLYCSMLFAMGFFYKSVRCKAIFSITGLQVISRRVVAQCRVRDHVAERVSDKTHFKN